jgi:hypothetical protein
MTIRGVRLTETPLTDASRSPARPRERARPGRSDDAAKVTISPEAVPALKPSEFLEKPGRIAARSRPGAQTDATREALQENILRDLRKARSTAALRPEFVAKIARKYPAAAAAMLVMGAWSREKRGESV